MMWRVMLLALVMSMTIKVRLARGWSYRSLTVCILRSIFFVYMVTLHVLSEPCFGRWVSHMLLCGMFFCFKPSGSLSEWTVAMV